MTDLQAAIGIHQLPKLDQWIERRAELVARYDELLRDAPVESPPPAEPGTRHAQHLYQVLVEPESARTRDELLDFMTASKIGVGVHYRAVHLHEYYRKRFGFEPGQFPVATDISNRTLSLPLSPALSEQDQDDVVEALLLGVS
jgi:dTDP-4-amino-4,6-dideoxygalactose transaminase